MKLTAFKHPAKRGYLVYQGHLDKPNSDEPDEMNKADIKFLEKRGADVHWHEEWSV
jgi:hypothetical protein